MVRPSCERCHLALPQVKKGGTGEKLCRDCFVFGFEEEVYSVCQKFSLFNSGERIVIGVSGGKDSSALLHCMYQINNRYKMGLEILMLAIDEGIQGYRDDSLKCVELAQRKYNLPLKVISYEDIYEGWTMDRIVGVIGGKQNCSYCGILRRQALERGSRSFNADKMATGHNADDSVETILMNILRGDFNRLSSCSSIMTIGSNAHSGLTRVKPFYYSTEKDIVLYCHFERLDYFSTECTYAPNAFRGLVRTLVKQSESHDPTFMQRMLGSFDSYFASKSSSCLPFKELSDCIRCGLPCMDELCKACLLIDALNSASGPHFLLAV